MHRTKLCRCFPITQGCSFGEPAIIRVVYLCCWVSATSVSTLSYMNQAAVRSVCIRYGIYQHECLCVRSISLYSFCLLAWYVRLIALHHVRRGSVAVCSSCMRCNVCDHILSPRRPYAFWQLCPSEFGLVHVCLYFVLTACFCMHFCASFLLIHFRRTRARH